ncbi:DUF2628 domain-containing protein [Pelagibacterium limicola]|uniref:DUF2628 domain-containing protein n=1 Tax=Pelagibacterium limicola TaxID=2791022 RepID=UPI0018AFF476|nr:DUF2628 domain-containing protein [Pelagibacterium limicola]
MSIFAIHSRPEEGPEAIEAVPERFVWSAFLFTPFWALAKHAWAFLALWLLVVAILAIAHAQIGVEAAATLYGLFALWSGFAAPGIINRTLMRAGWLAHGDLAASDRETAERAWLERVYGAAR